MGSGWGAVIKYNSPAEKKKRNARYKKENALRKRKKPAPKKKVDFV
jgi:hypothetical protein